MSAEYAYHISQNHALLDGNKRVALASALGFLELNAFRFYHPQEELYFTMMQLAIGEVKKKSLADFFVCYAEKKQ
jgi:death-on-curing protein